MATLDISPMLTALREAPSEFDMRGGELRHIPSRHTFGFSADGRAMVTRTRCDCALLTVSERQSAALKAALGTWTATYWDPLVARRAEERRVARINRAFARHFQPGLHRLFDRVAALWHRAAPDVAPLR
jgi:hypothetical protein